MIETQHSSKPAQRFKGPLKGRREVCLDVPGIAVNHNRPDARVRWACGASLVC